MIYTVASGGLIVNCATGIFIVLAFSNFNDVQWENATETITVLPDVISVAFLIDALRRLKIVTKGVMIIQTWQMIWHIWSFALVAIGGILLCVATRHTWQHANWFYVTYELIVLLVFLCELPFIYIISKVVE